MTRVMFMRLLRLKYFFVANLVVFVLLAFVFGRSAVRNRQIEQEIFTLQKRQQELEVRNREIRELGSLLRTESFLEREARLKLGQKKPGEQVVVVQAPLGTEENDPNEGSVSPLQVLGEDRTDPRTYANPAKWRMYLFHREAFEKMRDYVPT